MNTTSHDLLTRILESAPQHAARTALVCYDGQFSYAELLGAAHAVAARITELVDAPARIGVVADDDRMTYAALLGCWLAGAAYTPLNTANPERRNREILEDAGLQAVISSRDHPAARAAAHAAGCPWIEAANLPQPRNTFGPGPEPAQAPRMDADRLAYILFTSGTTGRPKGVPIRHTHLASFADAWLSDGCYAMSADDRFLQMFDLGFDLSVMNIFVPWALGASVHVVPHRGAFFLNVYRTLAESEATVAMLVPSVLSYLSRFFDEISLPALRYSLFCGEALPHSLAERWAACVPNAVIQNTYGPTEATIFCYAYRWDRAESAARAVNGIVPIGTPVHGMGGVILDETGAEVADGTVGELCLYGAQVAGEYWDDAERTAAAYFTRLIDGRPVTCYRTGDLASRDPDGTVFWRGRTDHQVKIDGHRIELAEIEAHGREISDASAVAAVVQRTEAGHPRLVLFLEGGAMPVDAVAEALGARLPGYMRPTAIHRLDALPLNANGKIDRNALAAWRASPT